MAATSTDFSNLWERYQKEEVIGLLSHISTRLQKSHEILEFNSKNHVNIWNIQYKLLPLLHF